jgi:hypothetical protein
MLLEMMLNLKNTNDLVALIKKFKSAFLSYHFAIYQMFNPFNLKNSHCTSRQRARPHWFAHAAWFLIKFATCWATHNEPASVQQKPWVWFSRSINKRIPGTCFEICDQNQLSYVVIIISILHKQGLTLENKQKVIGKLMKEMGALQ